ncbi:MAG: hypothetical protein RJA70_4578 [Pseudomonadota bacterium]|jgi:uncharacterized protein YcbX
MGAVAVLREQPSRRCLRTTEAWRSAEKSPKFNPLLLAKSSTILDRRSEVAKIASMPRRLVLVYRLPVP